MFHLTHGRGEPVENRARDDCVADVELDDVGQGRDRLDIVVMQAMTGVHGEPQRSAMSRSLP